MPSYEQRGKSKLWTVRFRESTENGEVSKRLSGFKTKREAQQAYERYQAELMQGPKETEITVAVAVEEYLKYAKMAVKESSFVAIESRLARHVVPYFENKKIKDLKPPLIATWQNELVTQGLSPTYIDAIRTGFIAVWHYTESYCNLGKNPFDLVKPPRDDRPPSPIQYYTYDDWKQFIEVVKDPTYHLFFSLLYYTGMRRGECECLMPSDIQGGYISISKSLTRKAEDSAWKLTTPKTKSSIRKVSIPYFLKNELENYMVDHSGNFIWGDEPLRGRTTDRRWIEYQDAAGLPHIRIHDLRHSHASFLISNGISIVAVSHRLGHKSTQQTLDTYAHMMPSDDEMILRVLEK
mgnify:CR=1 FL=1